MIKITVIMLVVLILAAEFKASFRIKNVRYTVEYYGFLWALLLGYTNGEGKLFVYKTETVTD